MNTSVGTAARRAEPALSDKDRRELNRKIMCVASGKGGVGKTWFAITLSHALARHGLRTLLFDGDLGLANVDVQLGLTPVHDLAGVVERKFALKEAVQHVPHGGFDVIAGRSGSTTLSNLDVGQLTTLRDDLFVLANVYDRVVLDLSAGIDSAVRLLARSAGKCIVITTDEPTALTDAYAFIKLSTFGGFAGEFNVVINMASSARDGERTYGKLLRACEGFLKISPPLAGVIRRDDKVRDSIRHQTSLLSRHPNTDAAADVEAIAVRLVSGP